MIGYWIFPNGTTYYTNNAASHYEIIRKCNLIETLIESSQSLIWTEYEIKNGYNKDLTYIALRLGYVRVTSYYNQLAIQFEHISNDIRNICNKPVLIDILLKMDAHLYKTNQMHYQYTVIEQLSTAQHLIFESFTECISFLSNEHIMLGK